MRFHARVGFLAIVCGVVLAALMSGTALAAEAPVVETLVAVNCKVEKCAQTETNLGEIFGPEFGPQVYVSPKKPNEEEAKKEGYLQAGGRVPFGITDFQLATNPATDFPKAVPTSIVKHIRTDVAPGLATNPTAVPECSMENFGDKEVGEGVFPPPNCAGSEVGKQHATVFVETGVNGKGEPEGIDVALVGEVYNLEPAEGLASEYGVALELPEGLTGHVGLFAHTLIKGNVEWGKQAAGTGQGDYHDYFEIDVSTKLPLISSRLSFEGTKGEGDFITNATSCPGHNTTTLKITDVEGTTPTPTEYTTPIGLKGCNPGGENLEGISGITPLAPFEPGFALTSGSTASDQPNQVKTEVTESHNPKANDPSQVKTASITLPEGMTLNAASAAGLEACKPSQARIHSEEFGVSCPAGSEMGTVSLEVPGLPPGSLKGSVYLGGPESGPITAPPYIMYVVANSKRYGVSVRLKGEVIPNEVTGQLTTVFNENPEQPFTNLTIQFGRGVLTPIANPLVCGTPNGTSSFVSVAGGTSTNKNASFGVSVTGCASPVAFAPTQGQAALPLKAGQPTAYTLNLERSDGQQYMTRVRTVLPPGLAGLIPAVEQCSEVQATSATCPVGSQIGTAVVASGAGPTPYQFTGQVFLTGPYHGAPFGMAIVVPTVAGPFNLGPAIARATINVEPLSGRVVVTSELPTIVKGGIPVRMKRVAVSINRPGFMKNPTNCGVLATESLVTGSLGATASLSTPFQAEGCSALAFKPSFKAKTSGKASKANGASLETTINMPAGGANVKSALVQLPAQLPSRLTTLQKACLAATFEANPYSCPEGSRVGSARANTTLLPGKLTGPAYLVSHGGEAFPDLELVLEANGVRVILDGKTNIKKGITTTNFASTPDAPVSSITVNLPLGPHSALAANGNLCTAKLVMPTTITGQNGTVFKQNTVISPTECGVQVVGHKVIGNTAYLTVRTFAPGRISGSGSGLNTVYRKLSSANKGATLKVPLSSGGRSRRRPFQTQIRVGFVGKKKGEHSNAYVTVTFG